MDRIWGKLILHQRTLRHETVDYAPAREELIDVLTGLCHALDIPRPMVLEKHRMEWEKFGRTRFTEAHFVEEIRFDALTIEHISDMERASKRDPRNDFS